jgi:chromosome segregation ATPase
MVDLGRMPARSTKTSAPTADEVPVSRAMLTGVRGEVLQRIDQAREETRADLQRLDGKIDAVRAELHEVKAELKADIHEVKAEIHEVKTEIHEVKAGMHAMQAQMARIEVLVEEQNARNRIVLDGITAVLSRQNQVEQRVTQVEDTVRKLATVRPAS